MTENIDPGIEMLREANAAFGNYTGEEPAIPDFTITGRHFLRRWAGQLALIAQEMKSVAAEMRKGGLEMDALLAIRLQLSVEETGEFAEALAEGDLIHAAKELTDMSYVTDGHYLTLGLADLKLPLYREVHGSNMTKLDPETGKPIINEAGRWVKGPAYREADIEAVLSKNNA